MRFGDVKYHIKFWYYVKEDFKTCRFAGVCPPHFVPTSLNKNITPNALLVKKFASQYIQPVANKVVGCTLIMLENLAIPEWITVPCAEKILTHVVCVSKDWENGDIFLGFHQEMTDIEVTSTLFQCNNGEIISSIRQCNGFMDCFDGEDENNCSCFVRFRLISDSYYCRYLCKKPECFCSKWFFQSHKSGCIQYKPLITDQNGKIDHSKKKAEIDLLYSCPNETTTIKWEIVSDLIPDCKSNADENILYLILTNNYKHNLTQSEISSKYYSEKQRYCFEGHPKMYHVSKECIYQVDHKGINNKGQVEMLNFLPLMVG